MPDADLLKCLCAHGVLHGMDCRAQGGLLAVGPGEVAVCGKQIAGTWLLDLSREAGTLSIEATRTGVRAGRKGFSPGAVPLYEVTLAGGELQSVTDCRRHCTVSRWYGRASNWIDWGPVNVLRVQGASLSQDCGEPLWTCRVAYLTPLTVDDRPAGHLVAFKDDSAACAMVVEYTKPEEQHP